MQGTHQITSCKKLKTTTCTKYSSPLSTCINVTEAIGGKCFERPSTHVVSFLTCSQESMCLLLVKCVVLPPEVHGEQPAAHHHLARLILGGCSCNPMSGHQAFSILNSQLKLLPREQAPLREASLSPERDPNFNPPQSTPAIHKISFHSSREFTTGFQDCLPGQHISPG